MGLGGSDWGEGGKQVRGKSSGQVQAGKVPGFFVKLQPSGTLAKGASGYTGSGGRGPQEGAEERRRGQ